MFKMVTSGFVLGVGLSIIATLVSFGIRFGWLLAEAQFIFPSL